MLPDEVIINLHSGIYDTNLHHISRYSLAERLNSDCSYYKDLVVRVAGYSAFFNVLSKQTQDDIIGRTEQTL